MSYITGPLFGVLGAFALERLYNWYRDEQNRMKLEENLRSELESCLSQLTRARDDPVPCMHACMRARSHDFSSSFLSYFSPIRFLR